MIRSDYSIKSILELEQYINNVGFEFLKKEGVTLSNLVLNFITDNKIYKYSPTKKSYEFLAGKLLSSKNIDVKADFEVTSNTDDKSGVELENIICNGFEIKVEEGELLFLYRGQIIATCTETYFGTYMETFVQKLTVEGNLKASEFYVENVINSTKTETTILTENCFFETKDIGFASRNEIELYKAELNDKLDMLTSNSQDVLKMIENNISPNVKIIPSDESEITIDESYEKTTACYINASGKFELFLGKTFSTSEIVEFDSNYFIENNISNYVDNINVFERDNYLEPGNLDINFDGDILLVDSGVMYYVAFSKTDSNGNLINESEINKIKTILLDKDNNILQLDFLAKVYQYDGAQFENAMLYSELDVFKQTYLQENGKLKVIFVNPSFSRKLKFDFNIKTKYYKSFILSKNIDLNKDINLNLLPAFEVNDEINTSYKIDYTDDSEGVAYSKKIGFGFITEPEQSRGNRQIGDFDFSKGLIDEETGSRVAIKRLYGRIAIPTDLIDVGEQRKLFAVNGNVLAYKKIGSGDLQISYEQDLTTLSFDGATSCTISPVGLIDMRFNLVLEKGKIKESTFSFENSTNNLSTPYIFLNILKDALVLDSVNSDAEVKSIFFNGFKFANDTIDKQMVIGMELETDKRKYNLSKNFVLVSKEIKDASILINSVDTSILTFFASLQNPIRSALMSADTGPTKTTKDIFLGGITTISFSNVFDVISNKEVSGFKFEIYDGVNYNVLTNFENSKKYKDALTPLRVTYMKDLSDGAFKPSTASEDTNIDVTNEFFNLNRMEIYYELPFEIFEKKDNSFKVKLTIFKSVGADVILIKNMKTEQIVLDLSFKYQGLTLEEGLNTQKTYINDGSVLTNDEGKEVFYSKFIKKMIITSNFDLRYYKKFVIDVDLTGTTRNMWLAPIDGETGTFVDDTEEVRRKINEEPEYADLMSPISVRITFEYDENKALRVKYLPYAASTSKDDTVSKRIVYVKTLSNTNTLEFVIGFLACNFDQNLKYEITAESLIQNINSWKLEDFIALNLNGEFSLNMLNQYYLKADVVERPDIPQIYLLSSLNVPGSSGANILPFLKTLKFYAPSSEPLSNNIVYKVIPLKIIDGKITVEKVGGKIKFLTASSVENGINYYGQDYQVSSFPIDFTGTDPVRAFLIFAYVSKSSIPGYVPINVFLGDSINNMINISGKINAKNYTQKNRMFDAVQNISVRNTPVYNSGVSGLNVSSNVYYKAANGILQVGKIYGDLMFGDSVMKMNNSGSFGFDVILPVDYFDMNSYLKPSDERVINLQSDKFDLTSVQKRTYSFNLDYVNMNIRMKDDAVGNNFLDLDTTISIDKLKHNLNDSSIAKITASNITESNWKSNVETFMNKSMAMFLWEESDRRDIFFEGETGFQKKEFALFKRIYETCPYSLKILRMTTDNQDASTDCETYIRVLNDAASVNDKNNNLFIRLDVNDSVYLKNLITLFRDINNPQAFEIKFYITFGIFKGGGINTYEVSLSEYENLSMTNASNSSALKINDLFSFRDVFSTVFASNGGDLVLFLKEDIILSFGIKVCFGADNVINLVGNTSTTLQSIMLDIDAVTQVNLL